MLDLLDAGLPAPASGRFSTRRGGASRGAWASASLALHVVDDPSAVVANRRALVRMTGVSDLVFGEQVHGNGVALVHGGEGTVPAVDGLVTTAPGVGLVMLAADCLPLLFADADAGVVAAAHAGRHGLVQGVVQQVLAVMGSCGASPAATTVVIGPAVCGRCYELPESLVAEVEAAVPGSRTTTRAGTAGSDLAAGAEALLRREGVALVRRVGGCTVEQPESFYSYRREGRTGRHGGVVWLSG